MEVILPYLTVLSSIFAATAVIYSKFRPRFPIKVNCWFCQKDLVIPYAERNSWDCPRCEQYNGFCEDGGYNKLIPAQYSMELNPEVNCKKSPNFRVINQLCNSCSLNQQLKVQQLASFLPRNNDNFDEEVIRYRAHLEQVYRLCRSCDVYVEALLLQEERKLKPSILAWKLELSKKHLGNKEMIENVFFQCNRYVACTGYFMMWLSLMLHLNHYLINVSESCTIPDFWKLLSDEVVFASQVVSSIGVICSLLSLFSQNFLLLPLTLKTWKLVCVFLWGIMLFAPFRDIYITFEKMWTISALCFLGSCKLLSSLFTITKSAKPKLRIAEKKIETPSLQLTSGPKSNLSCAPDISKLDISSPEESGAISPKSSATRSPGFIRPKPVLSPTRFSQSNLSPSHANLTKASWVAGGYWQSNNWNSPSFTPTSQYTPNHSFPLSRSSSQSSGIGSIQTGIYNRSPPDSRPGSAVGEMDRLSVFSDNLDTRFVSDRNLSYRNGSPPSYQSNDVVMGRKLSTSSNTSIVNPSHPSQWSWLPFLLGFSLAVNVCVLVYFVALHSAKA